MGFGDISVFIFFGVVATMGSYFAQSEVVSARALLISIPMGALACAILSINNLRDRPKDAEVGKKTVAVRLGDRRARILFLGLLIIAHLVSIAALFISPWVLLTLLPLPLTFSIAKSVLRGAVGIELIPLLGKIGRLQMLFALLLTLAFII
jgi:1,4-dihydroxy-2-naphthoate octaprenyltransferase